MKERGIIFSGEMVKAILDDRKNQTRRVLKLQPDTSMLIRGTEIEPHKCPVLGPVHYGWKEWGFYCKPHKPMQVPMWTLNCPYGQPGDRLWVRETFRTETLSLDYGAGPEYSNMFFYRADLKNHKTKGIRWTPSIFMPQIASRITLEITDVRVERVQDISEEDIKAEGVDVRQDKSYILFPDLWNSLNEKRGYGWEKNNWVWVIGFKVII